MKTFRQYLKESVITEGVSDIPLKLNEDDKYIFPGEAQIGDVIEYFGGKRYEIIQNSYGLVRGKGKAGIITFYDPKYDLIKLVKKGNGTYKGLYK